MTALSEFKPWENNYKIYVLGTGPHLNQFFADVMPLSDHDYDIYELCHLIIKGLHDFETIEDELDEILTHYSTLTNGRKNGKRDFAILSSAIVRLHGAVRTLCDFFDMRDSAGIMQFRLAEVRNNYDIVLTHKDHRYVDTDIGQVPKPAFDFLEVKQKQLSSLSDLLGPDNGYSAAEFIAEASTG